MRHPDIFSFVLGVDLSLAHAGFAYLDDLGKLEYWLAVTNKVSEAKASKQIIHFPAIKMDDRTAASLGRLGRWEDFFVMQLSMAKYVAIEDYALRAASNSSYQIGELGGLARLHFLGRGVKLRLHDPLTVKMFVVHDGAAKPEDTLSATYERWPETKEAWGHLPVSVALDLAPAFGLAKMAWTEVQLRSGKLLLSDLHEKEIQVFNRATKANPTSILSRDWICK